MTEARSAELQAWLAEDRRNRGAYLRAQAALLALEQAVQRGPRMVVSGNDTEYGPVSDAHRSRWVRHFALAAGLAAAATLGVTAFLQPWHGPERSRQVMSLQDGSVVTLAEGAQVQVDMSGQTRHIVLLGGSATFQVAYDNTRPFVVSSGRVFAQATGTVYSVSRVGEVGATVDVDEGSVLVWAGDERDQAVLLRAGGRLTLDPGAEPAGTSLPTPEVAQISLDNDTLDSAVARFNHINHMQIIVADDGIGGVRITGLFNANDPQAFARAAAMVAGGHVVQRGENIIIDAR